MMRRKRTERNWRAGFMEGLEDRLVMAAPVIQPIAEVQVPAGKTVFVPVQASDADGQSVQFSASSNAAGTQVQVRSGRPYLELTVQGYGKLVFQLFDDLAPETVNRITGLVNQNFYDNLTFHRVVPGFVIQGGDPSGDGTGGPGFRFDDEFNPAAIFSGSGQLAMANSGKDSNGSQFFITLDRTRFLDFNHTIFGQLVRGQDVLEQIAAVPRNANDRPTTPVVISDAAIVQNSTDTVLQITNTGSTTTTALISVVATDSAGDSSSINFTARTVTDTTNDPPILGPVSNQTMAAGSTLRFNLSSIDLEGNPVEYLATLTSANTGATVRVEGNTVIVTPAAGFVGTLPLQVGVKAQGANSRGSSNDPYDRQSLTVNVVAPSLTLSAQPLTGSAGQALQNVVLARLSATPMTDASTLQASVNWGDGQTGSASVVARSDGTFDVVGTHTYTTAGNYPIQLTVTGPAQASVTGGTSATIVARTSGPLTVDIEDSADPPRAGDPIVYSISVSNPTGQAQSDVEVVATLPTGWRYVSSSMSPSSRSEETVTFVLGDLAAGETRQIRLTAQPVGSGTAVLEVVASPGTGLPTTELETTELPNGPAFVANLDRFGIRYDPTRLVVTFSEPVDRASTENPKSYVIRAAGPDHVINTRDDIWVPIRKATYDESTNSVTLTPWFRLRWFDFHMLRVRSGAGRGVVDAQGEALDGNRDGAAGGDFLAHFGRGLYFDFADRPAARNPIGNAATSPRVIARSGGVGYTRADSAVLYRPGALLQRYRFAAGMAGSEIGDPSPGFDQSDPLVTKPWRDYFARLRSKSTSADA